MAAKPCVLIDLNILLDVLQKREPFHEKSAALLAAVETGRVKGYVAAHSITTLFYLIRKDRSAAGSAGDDHEPDAIHQDRGGGPKHDRAGA